MRLLPSPPQFNAYEREMRLASWAVICCLAQKLNQQVRAGTSFPMSFGSKVFQEEKHVLEFIRSEAELRHKILRFLSCWQSCYGFCWFLYRRVMAINPTDSSCCNNFLKIFCEILPAKWQDVKFGLVCAKRSNMFSPDSQQQSCICSNEH